MTSWYAAVGAALLSLSLAPAWAGTMSAGPNAPAVQGDDIANYGEVTGTEKWWAENSAAGSVKGQTFRTGSGAVLLRSVTYQITSSQKAEPTKNYTVRVGTVSGTNFTPVYAETFTQTNTWNADEYMTWTFATPPLLNGDTTYGVDIGMTSSTSGWQTGIPYVNVTANEYAGGQSYTSGTLGIGSTGMTLAVSGDRIFHLHLEAPSGPTLAFVAGNPTDNATNALVRPELVATFNQGLAPGAGAITVRNLSDATETNLPVSDPRVSLSANLLKIATPDLIAWNKSYAIRIAPGAVLGAGGAPFAGITNDTAWNFTAAAGDPLLVALGALEDHINGVTNLSAAEIAAHSQTINLEAARFADSSNTISAVFDLVRTYDQVRGPLWVATGSLSRSAETNDLTWTIYRTMQGIMDRVYTAETLSNHLALLTGFKFNSSSNFPGPCPAPPATQAYTVAVNASFPRTFGRDTQGWTSPARRPTGAYLAPGTIAIVAVPPSLVGAGYKIRVGAHSWDHSNRPSVKRLDRSSLLYNISAVTNKVASPLGGGIYIEVPMGATGGVVSVTTIGAVRSPFFQATSFHQTTSNEWVTTERTQPGPWADYQTDKFMMQVPRSWMYNTAYPAAVMTNWDKAMDAINDLMGFPRVRGKDTMYYQVDVQLRASVYAPGYPSVNESYTPTTSYGGNYNDFLKLLAGPQSPTPGLVFHEQGHSYFFPKFGGESESAVNLLHVAAMNRAFGFSLDNAFRTSVDYGNFKNVTNAPLDNAAVLWMTSFNFSPFEAAMADWEKSYQPQGHAKFVDVARLFGWGGLDAFWYHYNSNDTYGLSYPGDTDSMLLQLCKSVGKDVRPLFHFWGILPVNAANLATGVAAAGLAPPVQIYDRLVHYKSLLPTNNASYQAWCRMWYGKQPNYNTGYGVEREHARQWDTNVLVGVTNQVRFPTEIYDEAAHTAVAARVQEILDLYYPAGRPAGSATLANLVPSAGTLAPAFTNATLSYTTVVPFATSNLTVTPTASDPAAQITVHGSPVASGSPSGPIALSLGTNVITTVVVSEDATGTNTYTLIAIRVAPGPRWWDGGTIDLAGSGDGVSAGGAGTWDTARLNWDQGPGLPHASWANGDEDTAVCAGTAGTVTLGTNVRTGGLRFDTAGYVITSNTLTLAGGVITANANATMASSIAGTAGLNKSGAGILTLSGSNTYAGGTVVSNGALLVEGSLGAGDVIVEAGGALGGNGTIGGSVTNRGTLSPGGSTGRLTTGPLTLQAGSRTVIEVDKGQGTNDVLTCPSVIYGGTLVVTNIGTTAFAPGDWFTPFTAVAYAGAFDTVEPAIPGPGLAWNTSMLITDGSLGVVSTVTSPVVRVIGWVGEMNLALVIDTQAGVNYVLEGATNLEGTVFWGPLGTNAGTGGPLTNIVPADPAKNLLFLRHVTW